MEGQTCGVCTLLQQACALLPCAPCLAYATLLRAHSACHIAQVAVASCVPQTSPLHAPGAPAHPLPPTCAHTHTHTGQKEACALLLGLAHSIRSGHSTPDQALLLQELLHTPPAQLPLPAKASAAVALGCGAHTPAPAFLPAATMTHMAASTPQAAQASVAPQAGFALAAGAAAPPEAGATTPPSAPGAASPSAAAAAAAAAAHAGVPHTDLALQSPPRATAPAAALPVLAPDAAAVGGAPLSDACPAAAEAADLLRWAQGTLDAPRAPLPPAHAPTAVKLHPTYASMAAQLHPTHAPTAAQLHPTHAPQAAQLHPDLALVAKPMHPSHARTAAQLHPTHAPTVGPLAPLPAAATTMGTAVAPLQPIASYTGTHTAGHTTPPQPAPCALLPGIPQALQEQLQQQQQQYTPPPFVGGRAVGQAQPQRTPLGALQACLIDQDQQQQQQQQQQQCLPLPSNATSTELFVGTITAAQQQPILPHSPPSTASQAYHAQQLLLTSFPGSKTAAAAAAATAAMAAVPLQLSLQPQNQPMPDRQQNLLPFLPAACPDLGAALQQQQILLEQLQEVRGAVQRARAEQPQRLQLAAHLHGRQQMLELQVGGQRGGLHALHGRGLLLKVCPASRPWNRSRVLE